MEHDLFSLVCLRFYKKNKLKGNKYIVLILYHSLFFFFFSQNKDKIDIYLHLSEYSSNFWKEYLGENEIE